MSDSGHPKNFGYVECHWCGTQVPQAKAQSVKPALLPASPWLCVDQTWCVAEQARTRRVLHEGPDSLGWDANGAPTGVDENGDAA